MEINQDLTAVQAAQYLGIDLDYVYKLLRAGRLSGYLEDGKWVVSAAAVRARLDRREGR